MQRISSIIIAPYALIFESCDEETFQQFGAIFKESDMNPLFVSCEVSHGLEANYEGGKKHLVFPLKRRTFKKGGDTFIFVEVLLPEKTSENTHELVPGVFINGTVGWIPITKIDQRECYIPYIYGKLDPFQLNPFHIGFKPFQVINGAIQLRIGLQGLPITSALAHPADTDLLGFKCPSMLHVWEGRIT